MKIGFVVNNIATEIAGYTTTHLAKEANNLGHDVWYINVADFAAYPNNSIHALVYQAPKKKYLRTKTFLQALRGDATARTHISLADLDVLFLRNDPAEDVVRRPWARLTSINFGRLVLNQGVIVVNDPNGLAQAVNKMYLLQLPTEVRPRTLITRDRSEIKAFLQDEGGSIIIKPLAGSGGRNVFLVRQEDAANLNQMIDAVETEGYVIAQEFLPAVAEGDIRLFLVNGKVLQHQGKFAAIHRVRAGEDIRSNMTAGATAEPAIVTEVALELAEMVRPKLVQDGMFFVGLDIVGSKMVEVNVFSPGGLESAEAFEQVNFSRLIIEYLERKVEYVRQYQRHFNNVEIATL
jgi:glutathione synthase